MKQDLIKNKRRHINKSTIKTGGLRFLSVIERTHRGKSRKNIGGMKNYEFTFSS